MIGAFRQLRREDPLAAVSIATTGVLALVFLVLMVIMLLVARGHAAVERANRLCESRAPKGVTGWTLEQTGSRRFECVYARNGRRTGDVRSVDGGS